MDTDTMFQESIQGQVMAPSLSASVLQQSTTNMPQTISPAEARAQRLLHNRTVASEWIYSMTGARIPSETDQEFRLALSDGIVLCQLLNALKPGTISRIVDNTSSTPTGETIRTFENLSNFIIAAKSFTSESFSASDLRDDNEQPQVVDCILSLRNYYFFGPEYNPRYSVGAASGTPNAQLRSSALWATAAVCGNNTTMIATGTPAAGFNTNNARAISPEFAQLMSYERSSSAGGATGFTPHANELVERHGGDTRDGLNYLMKSCTHMLKTRMGLPATPVPPMPEPGSSLDNSEIAALDAVGPILETVLANLTSEYEKRLSAKDQEHRAAADNQARLLRQVANLEKDVAHWKELAETKATEASNAATAMNEELLAAERMELDRLRTEESALKRELHSKQDELAEALSLATSRYTTAEAELKELRQEIESYKDMQARFKSMQEENRQLYNTVQDLRGNIRVYCRVRPTGITGDESNRVVEPGDEGSMAVHSHRHGKWHEFKFDKVFGEDSTQDDVYDETKPLIRSVLDGYNVCIFAYGQTGSGKTHTMQGTDTTSEAGRGIYYRALEDLFALDRERTEVNYFIKVQLLEVYNECVRDLLIPANGATERGTNKSLQLINTARSGSNVPDATQVEVSSTEDVLRVMALGARNRATAETNMNDRSSRSHQVLTVMVEGENVDTMARTHGCLHLIDLAGSERVARSGAEGAQLLEAQHINRSLSALGNVMQALAQKREHVPYRDSKLTQLLQDSLAGQAKSLMFMHIAPEMSSASETLSTLNFGKGVTEVTLGAAKKNVESGSLIEFKERANKMEREVAASRVALDQEKMRNKELQAEVERLKSELIEARGSPSQRGAARSQQNMMETIGVTIPAYRPSTNGSRPFGGNNNASSSPASTGSGSVEQHGLSRPSQVIPRLNLAALTPGRDTGSSSGGKVDMKQQILPRSNSKIPTPSGSLTSRGSGTKPSPLGLSQPSRVCLSARDSYSTDKSIRRSISGNVPLTARTSGEMMSARGLSRTSSGSTTQGQRRWM